MKIATSWFAEVASSPRSLIEALKGHTRRVAKGRELRPVRISPGLEPAKIIAVIVVRDEATRIAFLLDYYRRLGVDHFILIDNLSSDGIQDRLADAQDVSIYVATGRYGRARFGNDWVNSVCNRHCIARWVLYVDADEYLVFHGTPSLPELCDALGRRGETSLHTVMIDMYSKGRVDGNILADGQDPLDVCTYFDESGYSFELEEWSLTTWIKGGVRGRLFFPVADEGPALNKTPLVFWTREKLFLKSAHQLWPLFLNSGGHAIHGAILHFKFTETAAAKMLDVEQAAEHTAEYTAYTTLREVDFYNSRSRYYESSQTLVDVGLMRSFSTSEDQ